MDNKSHSALLDSYRKAKPVKEKTIKKDFKPNPAFYYILLVFFLALSVRLIFLYFFTEASQPSVGDVWHHWQIAYLSKTIGFKQGFLRLWDFKGLEYYWGLLHPLVLIGVFTITGSVNIIIPRIVSTLFGSGVITIIFLIVARYYNKKAAFASAIFLILMPTTIFHDTLGLQEPLGLFFLLLGVYLFHKHPLSAGISWMLAGMVRAEHWIFGAALVLIILIREKNFDTKIVNFLGYGVLLLIYMKYLLDKAGNAIYPIYWNYLVIGAGEWSSGARELSDKLQYVEIGSKILAIFLLIMGVVVFWKKFKSYLFLLICLFGLFFPFAVLGFGTYLYGFMRVPSEAGFIDKIWIGKLFAFPWGVVGIFTAIFLLYFLPNKIGKTGMILGSLIFVIIVGATQFIWPSIDHYYLNTPGEYDYNKQASEFLAENYSGNGKIMLPAQSEFVSYFLVHDEGITGENLGATFYDPFYYYEGDDPFAEWDTFREEIVDWLEKENVELIMSSKNHKQHNKMFALEKDKLFEHLGAIRAYNIYKVNLHEEQ